MFQLKNNLRNDFSVFNLSTLKMSTLKMNALLMDALVLMSVITNASNADETIKLYSGYVTKVSCKGKLLLSSVGDELLVKLDAYPSQLGCGLLLKPLQSQGKTNLILESSSYSIQSVIEIRKSHPDNADLKIELKGEK